MAREPHTHIGAKLEITTQLSNCEAYRVSNSSGVSASIRLPPQPHGSGRSRVLRVLYSNNTRSAPDEASCPPNYSSSGKLRGQLTALAGWLGGQGE
jgi:hypothetical protein